MRGFKIMMIYGFALLFKSCGLDKMAQNYNKVIFEQSPTILELHGGNVNIDLKVKFPESYFEKKATLKITPLIISDNGIESEFRSVILQGEHASGGTSTIFYESGGTFSYQDKILYEDHMITSSLELRALAKLENDSVVLPTVTIARGVITTAANIMNDETIAFAHHGYEDTTILSVSATIYFLVNKSNIRTSEKSDKDVKKLQEFIEKGYKTESFVIRSYASPEGSVNINDALSDRRNENTLKYAKYLLNTIKADGSSDDDNYSTISVGEDWDGFYNLIDKSSISGKGVINRIIKSNKSPEAKEQAIRDMAEVYDAIDKDILPYLRKAEILINAYEPKKTMEEITSHSIQNPSVLTVDELLYSASIERNDSIKILIYKSAVDLYNDWRAYNNIAAVYMEKYRGLATSTISSGLENNTNNSVEKIKNDENPIDWLNRSIKHGGHNQSPVLTNLGILAAWNGDLDKAQTLFDKAETKTINQAILDVRQGNYISAIRLFQGTSSYNETLANILHGNNINCNEETVDCYYLNAIVGARESNDIMLFTNLEKAINACEEPFNFRKKQILKDLEFLKYREDPRFISLTK